ncbi:membrane protein [Bacteroidia bacterium]|nr:membrane protein [Bacteroidia bacterium]
MKKIKKTGKIVILLLLAYGFGGCEDFLQYEPYGPGDVNSFWKSEADVTSALNSFYVYAHFEETAGRGHYWFENCSDNMITGRPHEWADRVRNFQMAANDAESSFWTQMYRVIGKANDVLRFVPAMDIPQDLKNNALGTAYFFRAYGYLWLCPWYGDNVNGGIPILDDKIPFGDVDALDVARPPKVTDNYDMIIDDMKKAGDLLGSWSEQKPADYGRPYNTAAWAFAARAALYAAQFGATGYYSDGSKYHGGQADEKEYYDVVIEMCEKVMTLDGDNKRELHRLADDHKFDDPNTNSYGLPASNFSDLFRMENNFSKEYIYSILGNGAARSGPKFHGMSFHNTGFGGYNTWGYYHPTAELYEAFEEGDTRRDATILAPGQKILHPTATGALPEERKIQLAVPGNIGNVKASDIPTGLLNRKMHSVFELEGGYARDYWTSGDFQCNNLGVVVMRYADILLMKAEALIWSQSEGNGEAKTLLNQIRERAGLLANSDATKAQLKNERRCELAFEFLPSRHLDLVRWGDAESVYKQPVHGYVPRFKTVGDDKFVFNQPAKTDIINRPVPTSEMLEGRVFNPVINHVFPIHQNILSTSKGVLIQNDGY